MVVVVCFWGDDIRGFTAVVCLWGDNIKVLTAVHLGFWWPADHLAHESDRRGVIGSPQVKKRRCRGLLLLLNLLLLLEGLKSLETPVGGLIHSWETG